MACSLRACSEPKAAGLAWASLHWACLGLVWADPSPLCLQKASMGPARTCLQGSLSPSLRSSARVRCNRTAVIKPIFQTNKVRMLKVQLQSQNSKLLSGRFVNFEPGVSIHTTLFTSESTHERIHAERPGIKLK